jgi:hypothetical protein
LQSQNVYLLSTYEIVDGKDNRVGGIRGKDRLVAFYHIVEDILLEDPVDALSPVLYGHALVKHLGVRALERVVGVHSKGIVDGCHIFPAHEVFQRLHQFARAGRLIGLELDDYEIIDLTAHWPVMNQHIVKTADAFESHLSEQDEVVGRAEVVQGDVAEDGLSFQKAAWANRHSTTTDMRRTDTHRVRYQATFLVACCVNKRTPMLLVCSLSLGAPVLHRKAEYLSRVVCLHRLYLSAKQSSSPGFHPLYNRYLRAVPGQHYN